MSGHLTASPEDLAKQMLLLQLRSEYIALYTRRDELLNIIIPDLEVKYMNLIGMKRYENFCLQVELRAMKMKCELAQASLNRDVMADISVIEQTVKENLQAYYKLVEEQTAAIKAAREAIVYSANEITEMKELYRVLVKKVHPDLHPDQKEEMTDLFIAGQAAYKSFNIQKLREIILRLDLGNDGDDIPLREEGIDEMIDRIQRQIAELTGEIKRLESEFPCNLKDLLPDPEWVKKEQEALQRENENLKELLKVYTERYDILSHL